MRPTFNLCATRDEMLTDCGIPAGRQRGVPCPSFPLSQSELNVKVAAFETCSQSVIPCGSADGLCVVCVIRATSLLPSKVRSKSRAAIQLTLFSPLKWFRKRSRSTNSPCKSNLVVFFGAFFGAEKCQSIRHPGSASRRPDRPE